MLKQKSFTILIVILIMFFSFVGCSKEVETKVTINIRTNKSEIHVDETEKVLITLNKENENDIKNVVCISQKSDVATIIIDSAYGLAKGTTEIVCSLGKIKSNIIVLNVIPAVIVIVEPVPPLEIPETTPDTFEIVSLTSPINAGKTAKLVLQGKAGAEYTIIVTYKSGPSSAAGLQAKTADSKGRVVWTWEVGGRTSPGSWSIDVCGEEDCISSDFIVS